MNNTNIPVEFICPITLQLMDDPVICEDGYTYEREAILRLPNSLSPMTRQFINKNNLIPNRGLKDAIDRLKSPNTANQNQPLNQSSNTKHSNPQLPNSLISQSTEYIIRSDWNDGVYKIDYKIKPDDWVDSRYATTLIAVLDTSGSMGQSCSIGSEAEQDGFSRLNLLQHSMNTTIEMLNPGDELVLIQFNSTSQYIFNEKITHGNKLRAKSIIDSLYPSGGTYIWNGLRQAYESALKASNSNVHIMLLTDGQASDAPYDELKRYFNSFSSKQSEFEKIKQIKLTTFGFSYDINSKILFDIAEYTRGGFNFIPDATMVGTTFCNYLANILSPDLFVCEIEPQQLNMCVEHNVITSLNSIEINPLVRYELIRYHCYELLKDVCIKSGIVRRIDINTQFNSDIKLFETWISNLIHPSNDEQYNAFLKNLLRDFVSDDESQEQITKAISRPEWFNKWGYHYLLSLSLAHMTRQCHNFKDQGVQLYGSKMFQQLQTEAYQIFSTIQPPKPSLRAQVVRTSMSAYVDNQAGCFGPKCKIRLYNNEYKSLDELDGSELIWQGDGIEGAKIKYIIQTEIPEGTKTMCKIGNLIISEYHPVFDINSNGWVFPIQLTNPKQYNMNCMYNIVLETGLSEPHKNYCETKNFIRGYWVEIEGFKCVSLGHQLTHFDNSKQILKHDYFGTQKVIEDLEEFSRITCLIPTVPKIIRIYDYTILRDNLTNLVIGIKPKSHLM
jgi:Mg-chelatase subunit ChlD